MRQSNLLTRLAILLAASLAAGLILVPACSDGAGPAEVADVAIAGPPSTSVLLQSTLSLTAWALDAGGARLDDQTITWASDRPDVVSVTSTGRHTATVTGLGTGAAVITATSGRASDAVTISVRLTPVASLAITNPPQQSLDAGGGLSLTAVATDAAGNVLTGVDVRWSSSDTNAATVESTGATTAAVTGRTPGTVRITAAADSQTAIIALTVRPAPPVSVRFDPNPQDIVLPTGQTTRESAVVIDLLGNSVVRPTTWSSSDEAVATVDPVKGTSTTILAKAAGTAVIMASADGISGSITIHVPPAHHAFLWTAGNGMVDLGTLPGFTISDAKAVNAGGVVVGTVSGANGFGAFRWSAGTGMQALPALTGNDETAAYGVNASGQIVGVSGNRAVLWSPAGTIRNLGILPGGLASAALAINDLGQVAGYSGVTGGFTHAFLWTEAGGMQDLGGALMSSIAASISLTEVVGASGNLGSRWTAAGGMQQLPILAGAETAEALGVNDAGVVVGSASPANNNNCGYYCYGNPPPARSVEWSSTGEILDLNALSGFATDDNQAFGINNNGQVVGRNGTHAYLWSQAAGLVDVGVLPGRASSIATAINDDGQVVGSSW